MMDEKPQETSAMKARVSRFFARARDRALHLLLFQAAELSEAMIGFFCVSMGMAGAFFGSPWGTEAGNFWGGVALALFGVPQIAAAIHGNIALRHTSNLFGGFAAILNTVRAIEAAVPIAMVFYGTVTLMCSFFILRTDVHLGQDRARAARLDRQ